MMLKNTNSTAVKKLSSRILKVNKIRNIFAIFAIVLTTIMFTSLFTIGNGMLESQKYTNLRTVGTIANVVFKDLNQEKLDKLKEHPLVKEYGYSISFSHAENKEFSKLTTFINYATDEEAKMGFSYPEQGNMPKGYDEIAVDTKVLDALNISHNIGEKITIKYKLLDEERTHDFILSGFWKNDELSTINNIYVSNDFVKGEIQSIDAKKLEELKKNSNVYPGKITLYAMLNNSFNLREKAEKIVNDSGLNYTKAHESDFVGIGVNWVYEMDTDRIYRMAVPILILCLLVMFSGYLIIYNIFQISIVNDIKCYGLLKTIGTTRKQIKSLVKRQAYILCVIGIPIGLICGYIIGSIILPFILKDMCIEVTDKNTNPLIFILSALFAIITVYISCNKPGKIAGKISPVEAFKYCEIMNDVKNKKTRRSRGAKLYNMALYNLQRNKKKTVLVIISMSLSIVLLNCVYTLTNSFSVNKFIARNMITDFVVGNANYFNVHKHFETQNDVVSESIINSINDSDEFKDGGRIYYSLEDIKITNNERGSRLQLYGHDDFPISKLEIVQGSIDIDKLKTGNYILQVARSNMYGEYENDYDYSVGDKVNIKYGDKVKAYEVMAVVGINDSLLVHYSSVNDNNNFMAPSMILPSNEFKNIVNNPTTMSYVYDVKDGTLEKAEKEISDYTKNVEVDMMYNSKQTFVKMFEDMRNMLNVSGGLLIFIIGIIGVLNFINSILTSIISRKREFATIESIGMTKKQLKKMLVFEGLDYGIITLIVSSALAIATSFYAVKGIIKEFWFCEYNFTLKPIIMLVPFIVLFAVLIPLVSYKSIGKLTIIERLREN